MSESRFVSVNATPALKLFAADENAMVAVASMIAPMFKAGDCIALSGDLGAGKTSFARAIIRVLSHSPHLEVPSPTFTLIQNYEGADFPILHADLYRLNDADEFNEIGFEEASMDALALVEWPDRAPILLERDHFHIKLELIPNTEGKGRNILISGKGIVSARILQFLAIENFLISCNWAMAERTPIAGDASGRHFQRLSIGNVSAILMIAPNTHYGDGSVSVNAYRTTAKLSDSVRDFIVIANGLRSYGFSAPKVLASDTENGLVLVEDLGFEHVAGIEGPIPCRYTEATILLAHLHSLDLPREIPFGGEDGYDLPIYDIDALLIELDLFVDWYLPTIMESEISSVGKEEFRAIWRRILEPHLSEQHVWTLRDFHSPNLLWLEKREGLKKIGLIDFQDMLWGHPAYDLGSLLQDARTFVSEQLELDLFETYIRRRSEDDEKFDVAAFAKSYVAFSTQRTLKILGIFVRLCKRDGKPEYLTKLPMLKTYLLRNLNHAALTDFRDWLRHSCPQFLIVEPSWK